jgi:hypothetical protein
MEMPWENPTCLVHVKNILDSYHRLTGKVLLSADSSLEDVARNLFAAPFVLVAHGCEPDPVLNYGNAAALKLWEMEWSEFTETPSRYTAEAPNREERARLLAEVTMNGFISNYSGIRISKTGARFRINRATVWNVSNAVGQRCGQAATFSEWEML